ncbi:phenylalanine--tRNA ligase alpha subunit [Trichogramma pretiosum]|uniref:phenylalanine--tRNA ligase alpha subunit n=1 Tax=Trichogramma pretiosum TaxID=7493 RepID=UPI0006C9957A|nr:phenylalanine--tRNA ligase alpha subunit [Trichogramma pretiosum]XP_014236330.1 phenylalanine--tRNA ligase alpha subunit [Trichogramma pretiosum]XP_014236331.1 phenylalanine--tRNA ligase alpha subunit [Trichogramma pretiosum]XP_023316242.1 phenylalanine--tRNA ligase alpha subunit [Trichogramma pretiosum]XP_023316243.1 phenylalanine--tRNA ligase alpha subunit [Trichogramma pretiosum]
MTTELMENILGYLSEYGEADSLDLAHRFAVDHQKIVGAIKSLQAFEDLLKVESKSRKEWVLTDEGQHVLEKGSHEAAVYNALPADFSAVSQADILSKVPFAKVGLSKALAASMVELIKTGKETLIKRKAPSITDNVQKHMKELQMLSDDSKKEYKKRKLIKENIIKIMVLQKGPNFSTKIEKPEADLTADLLMNDAWKTKKFKPINLNALGAALDVGHLHPLLKVRTEFRKIFLEMGFEEMPTNNYVENSFWNFDALFQPQQHPARDAHDTFFISEPAISSKFPEDYLKRVETVHSKGGYGSQGYKYDWKIEEAQKNLLRTHTTAVSARMLYQLMQKSEFKPVRYFSIDRVFRNETLDATHLAEFHQVEGVIADYDLTLGDLIGVLYEFFKKLGIEKLEFKPAYNPYTEPSMEIFCFHEGLNKWIEIGNSGVFRPEMLLPMGLPENVNVIAWGLSLERPTMIKYGLNNIRDLVGPKVDLQMVQENPLCRLDKCRTAIKVNEKVMINNSCSPIIFLREVFETEEMALFCDADHPPCCIKPLLVLLNKVYNISVTTHEHSSVVQSCRKDINNINRFLLDLTSNNTLPKMVITLIWHRGETCLKLSNKRVLAGQVNVARYFGRLIEKANSELLKYESFGATFAAQIDMALSKIEEAEPLTQNSLALLHEFRKIDNLNYICGDEMSLLDVFFM